MASPWNWQTSYQTNPDEEAVDAAKEQEVKHEIMEEHEAMDGHFAIFHHHQLDPNHFAFEEDAHDLDGNEEVYDVGDNDYLSLLMSQEVLPNDSTAAVQKYENVSLHHDPVRF